MGRSKSPDENTYHYPGTLLDPAYYPSTCLHPVSREPIRIVSNSEYGKYRDQGMTAGPYKIPVPVCVSTSVLDHTLHRESDDTVKLYLWGYICR